MGIQSFTPLFEVLCGFNIAFALWDGLGKRVAAYAASRLDVQGRIINLESQAKIVEEFFGDADIVPFVSDLIGRMSRTMDAIDEGAERTADAWRRASGLLLAVIIMWIIAFAGLHPDYELPWASWHVIAIFIAGSLASVWVTVAVAVWSRHMYARELRGVEKEIKEKLGKARFSKPSGSRGQPDKQQVQ